MTCPSFGEAGSTTVLPGGVPGEPDRVIYRTATSLDGFIADEANSLAWLYVVAHDHGLAGSARAQFLERIGVLVEGSITYEWVLAAVNLLEESDKWWDFLRGSSDVRVHHPGASSAA